LYPDETQPLMFMTPFRKPELPAVKPAFHAGLSGESGSVTPELRRSESGHVPRSPKGVGGFSLIFMSIFITAMAMLFVSVLPGKEDGDTNAKTISDIDKLNTVEEHMRSFMAFNGRRPCPADGQYPDTSKYFGQEAAIAGTCQGGTPAAPLGPDTGTSNIIAGVIPTRSLGLDTSYAFDSYGRRFTYVVDKRATSTATCLSLEGITSTNFTATGKGGLTVSNIAGSSSEQVMYAYIQHGQSGYGAWPGDGSATTLTAAQSAARRVNSGSTNLAMQIDAGVAPGADPGASTFAPDPVSTLVKNSMTVPMTTGGKLDTGFDDLVWYRDDLKNTCCLGPKCVPKGFRVDSQSSLGNGHLMVAGIGDINGDGYPDLVLVNSNGYMTGWSYVIFGTSTMGSNSSTPWPIPPTGLDPTTLNGTNGFIIDSHTGTNANPMIQVGDINGDGYADLVIGANGTAHIMFGGPGACQVANGTMCPSADVGTDWLPGSATTVTPSNLTHGYSGVNGQSGVTINMTGAGGGTDGVFQGYHLFLTGIEIGDINKDGYNDIIAIGSLWGASVGDIGFVIFGMPPGTAGSNTPGTWSGTTSIDTTTLNGTNGFQFYSSDSNMLATGYAAPSMTINGAIGDLDNDTYNDIVIGADQDTVNSGPNAVTPAQPGATYVLYGRSLADWQSDVTVHGSAKSGRAN
jgi:hypothetical protein